MKLAPVRVFLCKHPVTIERQTSIGSEILSAPSWYALTLTYFYFELSYRDHLDENIGTPVPKNAKSPLPFDMRQNPFCLNKLPVKSITPEGNSAL